MLISIVHDEASGERPSGFLTQPYSRENWDKYWNDRVYYMWDVGPESCGGTYVGPTGPELIATMLQERRRLQLPDIDYDDRNRDKNLSSKTRGESLPP